MKQLPWFRTTVPIALIFAFRMFGLFMLIPIFSIYGSELNHATPILIGVALGAYGLSQGIVQMPFGILSDYVGRKPMLIVGLALFAFGSLLGAHTHSIYGMIVARTIQGCGAVGSVLIALIADIIPDNDRSKAMAIIGACIGLSFAISMIVSPLVSAHFGLAGIFNLTAILALIGFVILIFLVPTPIHQKPSPFNHHMLLASFLPKELLKCHIGICGQHFILTASFFAVPLILKNQAVHMSYFYLSLMMTAFCLMLPIISWSEKFHHREKLFKISVLSLLLGQLLLIFLSKDVYTLWISLFIYFVAFNILEALFPAMIAKAAPADLKGTATGIYSTLQFLGIFLGGCFSGLIYQYLGVSGIFITNSLLCLAYLSFF